MARHNGNLLTHEDCTDCARLAAGRNPNARPNGAILYQGPSAIDGAPIVVIVTGLKTASHNSKTGDMLQTWILRSDINPKAAANGGQDHSICGNCVMRRDAKTGKRRCYVTVGRAPQAVWLAFKSGAYRPLAESLTGRKLRLGAYGDPAAAPFEIWASALNGTVGHTGYTHQWRNCDARFQTVVMASIDFAWETRHAAARGWRSFRVNPSAAAAKALNMGANPASVARAIALEEKAPRREIICPASAERGHVTSCAACLACSGTGNPKRQFDVVINEH